MSLPRTTTWRVMDEWITQWSTDESEAHQEPPAPADDEPGIGTNKSRRHRSVSSRKLAR